MRQTFKIVPKKQKLKSRAKGQQLETIEKYVLMANAQLAIHYIEKAAGDCQFVRETAYHGNKLRDNLVHYIQHVHLQNEQGLSGQDFTDSVDSAQTYHEITFRLSNLPQPEQGHFIEELHNILLKYNLTT
jgi:nitrogen-specific signal transduction histidine kinase